MPNGESGHGLRGVARGEDGPASAAKESNHRQVLCSTGGGGRVDTKRGGSLVHYVTRAIPLQSSPFKNQQRINLCRFCARRLESAGHLSRVHRSGRHRLHGHEKFRDIYQSPLDLLTQLPFICSLIYHRFFRNRFPLRFCYMLSLYPLAADRWTIVQSGLYAIKSLLLLLLLVLAVNFGDGY